MREENFGPIANADGSPSDMTIGMLAGTGRDAQAFTDKATRTMLEMAGDSWYGIDRDARLNAYSDARWNANLDRQIAYERMTDPATINEKTDAEVSAFCAAMHRFAPMDGEGILTTTFIITRW